MGRRRVYAWAIWINLCLALVLGGCVSQERPQTPSAPTPAPAPQTDERPAAPQPPLRVGLTPNYPPVIFKAEGHLTGLEVDLAHGLNEELGRPIELVELDWEALIPALEDGRIDVIMSGMSITEARAQRVRFVEPYLRIGQMAIIRKVDSLKWGSPAMLARMTGRVGFVAGTTGAAYVQEQLPQAEHVPVQSADEGLEALRAETMDVFVHDALTAWRVGENESTDILTSSFSPLTEEYLAWAVRKTDDALHRDLESVLARWRSSGRLQALFHKWLRFRMG